MDDFFSSVLAFLLLLMEQGFKFQPTNEELISKYLVPKTRGGIMGGFPMAVVNLCEHEPWDLPGKSIIKFAGQVTWYFLCPRDLRGKADHRRKTKAGNWKSTSEPKSITSEHSKKKIGVVRTLRFYEKQVITGWMIYEFDLIDKSSQFKKGQYVLCKLEWESKGEKNKKGEQSHHIAPVSHSEVQPSQIVWILARLLICTFCLLYGGRCIVRLRPVHAALSCNPLKYSLRCPKSAAIFVERFEY
ncbi:hypothetical protein D5086_025835 [Populus alba]|uniref:Uncharacterized protein n=1 Tax=Populus alba TaxID=43335 RepID=A0ACC4B080_POPAL